MAALLLSTIETQVMSWMKQGKSQAEMLSNIKAEYPSLSPRQFAAVQVLLGMDACDPLFQLKHLQEQRQVLLERLEPRLAAEDAPVSVFNLYRGILRDQEACLWKLLAQQPASVEPTPSSVTPVSTVKPMETKPAPAPKRAGCMTTMLLFLLLLLGLLACWFARHLPHSIKADFHRNDRCHPHTSLLATEHGDLFLPLPQVYSPDTTDTGLPDISSELLAITTAIGHDLHRRAFAGKERGNSLQL